VTITILQGDALETLRTLSDCSVQCCITSPPYFQLRNYNVDGQIGMEETPELFVQKLVDVFREVRRVLRNDGTLFLNIGDSYAGSGRGPTGKNGIGDQGKRQGFTNPGVFVPDGMKPKDMIGIPWMVAFALRADGWYLRSDIIWSKPNPMPESVTDRCTKSHEYIFLLAKKPHYYYDGYAIREPISYIENLQNLQAQSSHRELLQEQSTEGRQNGKVCGLYCPISEGLRQEIQSDREGKKERKTVLSLRERTESEKGLSDNIPGCPLVGFGMDRSHAGTLEEIQQGETIQRDSREVLADSERKITESKEGLKISENPVGTDGKETHGEETKIRNCQFRKYIDIEGMGGDSETIRLPMCVLPETSKIGNGSCDTTIEGWNTHKGEYSSCVPGMQRQKGKQDPRNAGDDGTGNDTPWNNNPKGHLGTNPAGRNRRTVWEIATQPTPDAHFATFPEALVEPCIKAGTSERGCCAVCGAPMERVIEFNGMTSTEIMKGKDKSGFQSEQGKLQNIRGLDKPREPKTTGWQPTCACNADTVPCVVLDPFGGSGTTAKVARDLKRDCTLIELNPAYIKIAKNKLRLNEQLVF